MAMHMTRKQRKPKKTYCKNHLDMVIITFLHIMENKSIKSNQIKSQVHKDTNLESCLNYIKLLPSSSTLLLMELDDATESQEQIQAVSHTIEQVSDAVPVIGNFIVCVF